MTDDGLRRIGSVLKPHGIDGSFLLYAETDFLDWLARRKTLIARIGKSDQEWHVVRTRPHRQTLIFKVQEVTGRDRVEELRGTGLYVAESEARKALQDDDTVFNSDLVGLEVWDLNAGYVGKVVEVLDLPDNTQLEVEGEGGRFLVPFVRAIVTHIDLEAGRLQVDLPPGLVELGS